MQTTLFPCLWLQDRVISVAYKLLLDSEVFVANPEMSTRTILEGMNAKSALLLTPGAGWLRDFQ